MHVVSRLFGTQQSFEQIGFLEQAVEPRSVSGVDAFLREPDCGRRVRCDAVCQVVYKRADLIGFEDAVEPSPAFGRLGIEIVATEDQFECPPAPPRLFEY